MTFPHHRVMGLKVFSKNTFDRLDKAALKHPSCHGGEQVLFVSWCVVSSAATSNPVLLFLTSLGRLLVKKEWSSPVSAGHVLDMVAAIIVEEGLLSVSWAEGMLKPPLLIKSTHRAVCLLQEQLWTIHSVARGELSLKVNMPALPFHLLPPLSPVDGNLHASYTIHANHKGVRAHELAVDLEDLPAQRGVRGFTAMERIRQWAWSLEVDVKDWRPDLLLPLARALERNQVFVALRADGNQLHDAGARLAPVLAHNERMICVSLRNIAATPVAVRALGTALASNPNPQISVIDVSFNQLGDEGAVALAAGVGNLPVGVLAELKMAFCNVKEEGITAVVEAIQPQTNLLKLDLSGNALQRRGTVALRLLLTQAPKLTHLYLEAASLDLDVLGGLGAGVLKDLEVLDLSASPWTPALASFAAVAGPRLRELGMRDGAALVESTDAAAFLAFFANMAATSWHGATLSLGNEGPSLPALFAAGLPRAASPPPLFGLSHRGPIGDESVAAVARLFQQLEDRGGASLCKLDLSDAVVDRYDPSRAACVASLRDLVRSAQSLDTLILTGSFRSRAGSASRENKPGLAYGPELGALFQDGISNTKTITRLDVSGNRLGDSGILALSAGLRVNRSVRSLAVDNNAVQLNGLKALTIAVRANKKLHDVAMPNEDIGALLEHAARSYKHALVNELAARQMIKYAHHGRHVNHAQKSRGLADLSQAKRLQAAARNTKNKIRNAVCPRRERPRGATPHGAPALTPPAPSYPGLAHVRRRAPEPGGCRNQGRRSPGEGRGQARREGQVRRRTHRGQGARSP